MIKLVSILQDQERPPALLGRDHAVLPDMWCGYHEMEKPPPAISVGGGIIEAVNKVRSSSEAGDSAW